MNFGYWLFTSFVQVKRRLRRKIVVSYFRSSRISDFNPKLFITTTESIKHICCQKGLGEAGETRTHTA